MGLESNTGTNSVAHYGARSTNEAYGGHLSDRSGNNRVVIEASYSDFPLISGTALNAHLPEGAIVNSAQVQIVTAFDGTTPSLLVGNAGDDDAYIDAADVTEATPGVYTGTGAELGAVVAADGEDVIVSMSATDNTTGEAKITIEYSVA